MLRYTTPSGNHGYIQQVILDVSVNYINFYRNYGAELFAFGCRLGEKFDESLLREAFTTEEYAKAEAKRQQELGVQVRWSSVSKKFLLFEQEFSHYP